jgi:hypothetical protein
MENASQYSMRGQPALSGAVSGHEQRRADRIFTAAFAMTSVTNLRR